MDVTVEVTLTDPCDPPVRIINQVLTNQQYVLTDVAKPYEVPVFLAEPNFCPVVYRFDTTPLSDGRSAVTVNASNERQVDIEWTVDLTPLG